METDREKLEQARDKLLSVQSDAEGREPTVETLSALATQFAEKRFVSVYVHSYVHMYVRTSCTHFYIHLVTEYACMYNTYVCTVTVCMFVPYIQCMYCTYVGTVTVCNTVTVCMYVQMYVRALH